MRYTTEVPTDGLWKFVKVNGQYRWIDNSGAHKSCVKEGETPQAAGLVSIFKGDYWCLQDSWSMTLKIGSGCKEIKELQALINLPFRDEYS